MPNYMSRSLNIYVIHIDVIELSFSQLLPCSYFQLAREYTAAGIVMVITIEVTSAGLVR